MFIPNTDSVAIKGKGDPGGIGASGSGVGVGVGSAVGVGVGSAAGVGVGSGLPVLFSVVNSFSGLVVLSFVRSSCVVIGVSFAVIHEVTESFISCT